MGVEPIYPGLLLSALIWAVGRGRASKIPGVKSLTHC